MRVFSVLIGTCLLVALGLSPMAQQAVTDLSPIMKDVQAIQTSMRMNLTNNAAADAAKDAARLQDDFMKAEGFFRAMKAQDAVDASKANADAAGEIVKAAKANNLDAARAPAATIQRSCKACHDVHRDTLPDKTFKFK